MIVKRCLAILFLLTKPLMILWGNVFAWLQGQTLMQILQSDPIFPQYSKQVSAFSFQRRVPLASAWSSTGMDLEGQQTAHFLQILQKPSAPISTGLSGIKGRSVITAPSRTLGPNSFVIKYPTAQLPEARIHCHRDK